MNFLTLGIYNTKIVLIFGGYLLNSKLIPFTEGIGFNRKFFQNILISFFKNKVFPNDRIICYCMHSHKTSSSFFQLKESGFKNVKLYDSSFIDWYGREFLE